ncbi:MAG TPA: AEC family transporter [Burkholderiaceae bacterium]|nr:AEC family transporter [Burkholderiaceae bacterium]
MSALVFFKLLAIFVVVAIGWIVGKLRWLVAADSDVDPARILANAAYYIFVPALLFRTTARIAFPTMPWGTLVAVFVPLVLMLLAVYALQRRANRDGRLPVAAASVRAISAVFGNTVQVGIPMAAALFGETGLAIHLAIVSLHALVLLTVATALVEPDLARAQQRSGAAPVHLAATLLTTARNTVIHPVVLPVLAGLAWNALGLPLPAVADEILQTLGQAVVPLCLVLIGMSLAYYGVQGAAKAAVWLSVCKLLVLPALVLAIARWGFQLTGLPLAVVVMMAALPIGSNALIFAQRYRTLEAETTAATVFSTLAFGVVAPAWLALLSRIG